MAKQKSITVDRSTLELVAGLATILCANLMSRLYERGVIDDDDVEQIIEDTASGGLGDKSLDATAAALAAALRAQLSARRN